MVTTNSDLFADFKVGLRRFSEEAPVLVNVGALEQEAVLQEARVLGEVLTLAKPMLKYIAVERYWHPSDRYLMACLLVKKPGQKELLIMRDGGFVSHDETASRDKCYEFLSPETALRWGLEEIIKGFQGAFEDHVRKHRERAAKAEQRIFSCSAALKALSQDEEVPEPETLAEPPAPLPVPQEEVSKPKFFSKARWTSWWK